MQFFHKFGSSRKLKRKPLEAERSLKLQSIDGLLESTEFEKVKGSNIVKCVPKKYFSYIIDKIVLLRGTFYKNCGSPDLIVFIIFFVIIFINTFINIFIKLVFQVFKVSFFPPLSYRHMKIWHLLGKYKVNSLGTNEISYNIFDLHQMSEVAAHFQKRNKMFIYSFK